MSEERLPSPVEAAKAPTKRLGRRALVLGLAAGGAGALASVAGAKSAYAANGNPVLLGGANSATATTSISTTTGTGIEGTTSVNGQSGVQGVDTSSQGGYGVQGNATNNFGVYGTTEADGRNAVYGLDLSSGGGCGVCGASTSSYGVNGASTSSYGVNGASTSSYGVNGASTDSYGVYGSSGNATGVYGTTSASQDIGGNGVYGYSPYGNGVYGYARYGTGVSGRTFGNGSPAVYALDNSSGGGYGVYCTTIEGTALYALGNAEVTGSLSKSGGSFKIDHPLDPAGKYLYHSFVESPDMKNVYDGTVVLDADGSVTLEMPQWFEALNRDYRFQLTAVGTPAPILHISARLHDGRFAIAGGTAGQEVCWQLTGIRQDAWANAHRIPVEVDKPAEDQDRTLSSSPTGQQLRPWLRPTRTSIASPRPSA
jgi:hypothetical protein